MGNSQSSENAPPRSPSTSHSVRSRELDRREERDKSQNRTAGANAGAQHASTARKLPHLSHATKVSTPTANLVPASSTASTSTSNTYAQATVSASPASSHRRARSITSSTQKTRTEGSTSSHRSHQSSMGNSESRARPPSRSSTLPLPESKRDKLQPSPSSQPVDVPAPSNHDGFDEKEALAQTTSHSSYGLPPSNFSRPPRLPLPIDRDPEPTSPIVTPQGSNTPLEKPSEQNETDDGMNRRSSMLSSTTLDEEDVADIETFVLESDPTAQKVPTTLEWKGHGNQAYVTGTFAPNWEKKFRMHRDPEKDGVFSTTIPLPTGTHHLKFLVDNIMETSNELPTTVDFTSALVNYIEVVPQVAAAQPPVPAEPIPIPGTGVTENQETRSGGVAARPLDIRTDTRAPEIYDELSQTLQETVGPETRQPSIPEQTPQSHSIPIPGSQHHQQHQEIQQLQPKQAPLPKKKLPRPKYTSEIPDILLHLDLYNNAEDERYLRASKAIHQLPQPPSLPMFMSKSILNAATPHKDDASVLTMPNHTVLNHLATSSIRSGVLATSGTTRYKRKVSTTPLFVGKA